MDYAKILLQVLDLAVVGALTFDRAKALQAQLQPMIEEGRDPTTEEWDALRAEGIELDQRLDAANSRLNG